MNDPLAVLQRIRQGKPRPRPGECCDMCGQPIPDEHDHVVDAEVRNLMCTCRGCWLLFTAEGAGGRRFRAVPDRYAAVEELSVPGGWERLQIPVGMAFFFHNSTIERTAAFYPSPAGATESLLPLDAWDDLVEANPVLATLLADVEALLVRVTREATVGYVVPIDACYELVGHLRRLWRGFDGGAEARAAIDGFFEKVAGRAR